MKCGNNLFLKSFLFMLFMIVAIFSFAIISNEVIAVNIDSVSVNEQDVFYSNFLGNDVVNLKVQISGITQGNTATVTADFSNLGINVCAGVENNTVILTDSGNGLWIGSCNIGAAASINSFKTGQVLIDARESNGGPTSPQKSMTIGIYNISMPQGNSCYRFTTGTTNFVEQNNFGSMDIILVVEASDSSSCIGGIGYGGNWFNVAKIRFLGVNLADPAKAIKISDLLSVITINYSAPRSYQNNIFRIDSSMNELSSTNTFVEFYRLPFLSQPTNSQIVSDNSKQAEAITWSSNGVDSIYNYTTYNVSFTVTSGFRGYTITDNTVPIVAITSPSANQNFNTTPQIISVTINTTKTELSKALFYLNNILVAQYLYSSSGTSINTANCVSTNSVEVVVCTFNISNNDGNYVLNVSAYDFGAGRGNVASTSMNFVVQAQGPQLSISGIQNGSTYEGTSGSMLKFLVSATDGNGLSKCWYDLDGISNNLQNCNSTNSTVQLYLNSDEYLLKIFANDTLGKISSQEISFTVSDSIAPIISDSTNANGTNLKKTTTIKISTDENSTCKFDSSDVSYNKMKNSFTNEILTHTAVVNTSGNDTFIFYARCEDMSENVNDKSIKLILGKIEAEIVAEVPKEDVVTEPMELVELGLLKSGQNLITVSNKDIAITDILLTTIGTADDVVITFIIPSKPSYKYGGKVYQYIDIVHGSLKNTLISGAKIKFNVEQSWIKDNSINSSNIFLFRYSDGKWTKLPTVISKTTDSRIEYTAESPGLSIFAISTEEIVKNPEPKVEISNTTNVSSNNLPILSEEEKTTNRRDSVTFIVIAAVIFVLLIIYILAEINYRKGPPSIFPHERTPWAKLKKLFGR